MNLFGRQDDTGTAEQGPAPMAPSTDETDFPTTSTEYAEYEDEDAGVKGGSTQGESELGDTDEFDYPLSPEDQDMNFPDDSASYRRHEDDEL